MTDSVQKFEVSQVEGDIKRLKDDKVAQAARIDEEVADLEALLADLKKL